MRGASVRESRRELRRTVGTEATGVINAHTTVLDHQVLPNLNALQARVDNLDDRVRTLERVVTRLEAQIDDVATRLTRVW